MPQETPSYVDRSGIARGQKAVQTSLELHSPPPLQGPTKYPFLFLPYHLSGGES